MEENRQFDGSKVVAIADEPTLIEYLDDLAERGVSHVIFDPSRRSGRYDTIDAIRKAVAGRQ